MSHTWMNGPVSLHHTMNPEATHPTVSCIIVNYETSSFVSRCVASLRNSVTESINIEIIVVDNPSQAHDIENLRSLPIDILVSSDSNVGYGIACNLGRKSAHGDYICILNPDTVVNPQTIEFWVKSFRELSASQPDLALLAPTLINENETEQRSTYHFLSPLNYWAYHSLIAGCLKKFRKSVRIETKKKSSRFLRVDWAMGAAYLVKSEAWNTVQGFSDKFFMYAEDQDLCKRLQEHGYSIWQSTQLRILHTQGEPSAEGRASGIIRFFDGLSRYIRIHYSLGGRISIRMQIICDMTLRILFLSVLRVTNWHSIMTRNRMRGYCAVFGTTIKTLFQ